MNAPRHSCGARAALAVVQKGLRIRMGRYPAEIAEGAEGRGVLEGGEELASEPFSTTALVY